MTSVAKDQWTVRRLLEWTANYLKEKGLEDSLLSGQLLLAKAMGCSKVDLYLRFDQIVGEEMRQVYRELVRRAAEGEPIAYLVGKKEFFSLEFDVGPDVLIPRPETELLVQWVIRKVRSEKESHPGRPVRILELGTGSGCISISLARFLPTACHVIADDASCEALAVAQANCRKHQVTDRVELIAADLFEAFLPGEHFDFVVGNLPYVTEADFERLPRHIRDFEPPRALRAGSDGLDVIQRAIAESWKYLKKGAYLVLEIGYNQAEAVQRVFAEYPYEPIVFEKDHAQIRRVAIGRVKEAK